MVCKAHQNEFSKAQCINCHHEICPDCIKEFGYFCGLTCKEETREKTSPLLSSEEKDKLQRMDLKANRLANVIVWFIPLCLILGSILFFSLKILDKSGKVRWEMSLQEIPIFMKTVNQKLLCLFEKNLIAHDALSGKILWHVSLKPENPYLPFLLITSGEIILADESHFYRIHPENGTVLGSLKVQGRIVGTPVADEKFIYCLTMQENQQPFDYSIRETGRPYQIIKLKQADFQTIFSSSLKLVYPDKLLMEKGSLFIRGSRDYRNNLLYCVDSENGKIKWEKKFKNTFFGDVEPVFQKNSVFIVSGKHIVLYSMDGTEKWRKKFSFPVSKTSITDAGYPVILSSGKIMGLNPQNGSIAWDVDIGFNEGDFLTKNNMIYVSGVIPEKKKHRPNEKIENMLKPVGMTNIDIPREFWQRRLYAIDGSTGEIRWTLDRVSGNPLMENNQLFLLHVKGSTNLIDASKFMGESSVLYCVRPSKGKKLWQQTWEGFTVFIEIGEDGCYAARSVQFFSPGDIFNGPKDPPKYYLTALYP